MATTSEGVGSAVHARRLERMTEFAEAWNRHDIDTLMSCMTEDCVYEASAGPEAWGARYVGRAAVREAYERFFQRYPDAQWVNPRHELTDTFGVTLWTFVAASADGARVESDGCDLLWFGAGDRISRKSALRKIRTEA